MKKQYDYAMIYLASGRVVLTNEFTHSGDIIIIKPLVKLKDGVLTIEGITKEFTFVCDNGDELLDEVCPNEYKYRKKYWLFGELVPYLVNYTWVELRKSKFKKITLKNFTVVEEIL
jgi:hypothetical protein